jgi:hypothetical protein
LAIAASAVKYHKTQKRNIVIPTDIVAASRTMRPLENNILGGFQAIVGGAEEGADDETKYEENEYHGTWNMEHGTIKKNYFLFIP